MLSKAFFSLSLSLCRSVLLLTLEIKTVLQSQHLKPWNVLIWPALSVCLEDDKEVPPPPWFMYIFLGSARLEAEQLYPSD